VVAFSSPQAAPNRRRRAAHHPGAQRFCHTYAAAGRPTRQKRARTSADAANKPPARCQTQTQTGCQTQTPAQKGRTQAKTKSQTETENQTPHPTQTARTQTVALR